MSNYHFAQHVIVAYNSSYQRLAPKNTQKIQLKEGKDTSATEATTVSVFASNTTSIHAAKNTLDGGQIILYIMASQMYKSKLFCTFQILLYIPNYFVHPKFFYIK